MRQAYVLGGIYLLVGVGQLVTFPGGGPISKWFGLATGLLFSFMAVIYLTSGVMMRRYQRRTSAVGTASDSTPRL